MKTISLLFFFMFMMTSCLISHSTDFIDEEIEKPYIGDDIELYIRIECDSSTYFKDRKITHLEMDGIVLLNDTVSLMNGYTGRFFTKRLEHDDCWLGRVEYGDYEDLFLGGSDLKDLNVKSFDVTYRITCEKPKPTKSFTVQIYVIDVVKIVKPHIY